MQKQTKIILLVLLAIIVVAVPQINLPIYEQSTITSKFIVFAYGCCFLAVVFMLYLLGKQNKAILVARADIALLVLLLYMIINRYIIQDNAGFSLRYLEVLGLIVIYVTVRILKTKAVLLLLLALIVSGIIQAIHGGLQWLDISVSNHFRFQVTGSFFNPGPFAWFLATIWPIALGVLLYKESIFKHFLFDKWHNATCFLFKYIPCLAIITIAVILPVTQSRAAWLAVFLSTLLLVEIKYSFARNYVKNPNRLKIISVAAILILVVGIVSYNLYHYKKESAEGRVLIWKVTKNSITDNPLTGVGFDRFKANYMNYQAAYFSSQEQNTNEVMIADNTYYAFNELLQFMAEEGFLGVICFGLIVLVLFKIKVNNRFLYLKHILITTLSAVLIVSFFSYTMQILPIKLVLVVVLAILAQMDINKKVFLLKREVLILVKLIAVPLLLAVVVKSLIYIKQTDTAFKQWKQALEYYRFAEYENAIKTYESAYAFLQHEGDFLMNYGKALTITEQYAEAIIILNKTKLYLNTTMVETALGDAYKGVGDYSSAETAYLKAVNMIPSRFYPLYLLAILYDETGQTVKARAMAKTILTKDVKIPSTAIDEMKFQMEELLLKHKK